MLAVAVDAVVAIAVVAVDALQSVAVALPCCLS